MLRPKTTRHFRKNWRLRTPYPLQDFARLWSQCHVLTTLEFPHDSPFLEISRSRRLTIYALHHQWVLFATGTAHTQVNHRTLITIWPWAWWPPFEEAVRHNNYWEWVLHSSPVLDKLSP
jgi:hypothetical protein